MLSGQSACAGDKVGGGNGGLALARVVGLVVALVRLELALVSNVQ